MLKLAIDSNIPIIEIETTDVVNIREALNEISGRDFHVFDGTNPAANDYMFHIGTIEKPKDMDKLYSTLVDLEACLVIVNPEEPCLASYKAGSLPTPTKLVKTMLMEVLDKKEVNSMMPYISGLTVKEVGEVARLTMTRDGSLTRDGVSKTRRMYDARAKGLTQVATKMGYYRVPEVLKAWAALDGQYFHKSPHKALTPRGLLFGGGAGTGKTMGAKYLAKALDVPLYRMDISGMQGKYVGESEGAMMTALSQIDKEAPCVVLIDEVEKVFNTKENDGVKFSLLGQLLWWLQEHDSKVLTVMTTNDADALPPELYREGRIDKELIFEGMTADEAKPFIKGLIKNMGLVSVKEVQVKFGNNARMSHAEITQMVYTETKKLLLDKPDE